MNMNKALNQAHKAACKAQDGVMKHDGKEYTLTFSHTTWTYAVINQEGDLLININEKSLVKAKKFLKFWLEN